MKRNIYVALVGVLLCFGSVAAETGRGGQPAAFRDLNLGGRPSAMGGAFTALAEGGSGFLYNPAGTAQATETGVSFSYRFMELDRRLGYASVSIPAQDNANLTVNWIYAGTAPLDARDEQGEVISGAETIDYMENLIGVTFSKRFIPELLIGGRVFYVQNNFANIDANSIGADLGALVIFPMDNTSLRKYLKTTQFGLAVEGIGAQYRWVTTPYWQTRSRETGAAVDEKFPVNYRAGVAFKSRYNTILTADFDINTASMSRTHFGGEYRAHELFALRAGLDDLHPTFGVGLTYKAKGYSVMIDFAYLLDKVGEGDDLLASFDIYF
jgi:hypothetical protein